MRKGKVKLFVVSIVSAACILLVCGVVLAASYECTVDKAGPSGVTAASGSAVYLTDTAGGWTGSKQFRIPAERSKEFLAVALAAITSGKHVKVTTNPATITTGTSSPSLISIMLLP